MINRYNYVKHFEVIHNYKTPIYFCETHRMRIYDIFFIHSRGSGPDFLMYLSLFL